MTAHARREAVFAALPDDGSYVAFATVAERVDGVDVYPLLRELEAAGRAVLTHGRGWRRAGTERAAARFRDDYLDRVGDTVARSGHLVQGVFPTTADASSVPFAYTVGLLDRLGCELVVTGALPPEMLQELLNATAALDPFPTARGVPQPKVMRAPYQAVLLDTDTATCDAAGYPLSVAHAWWRRQGRTPWVGFPVVQVCWPDADYRYPWHDSFAYRGRPGDEILLAEPPAAP